MNRAYLALGSNLGDRAAYLERAIEELRSAQVRVCRVSPVYETAPQEYLEQGWFLNMVLEAETELQARALLDVCAAIEKLLARRRTTAKGPRTIDIDILFYNDDVIDEPELQIPHPRYHSRCFVLQPLADLAPERRDPVTGRTVREMLSEAGPQPVRRTNIAIALE